jgi:hypothetical protein
MQVPRPRRRRGASGVQGRRAGTDRAGRPLGGTRSRSCQGGNALGRLPLAGAFPYWPVTAAALAFFVGRWSVRFGERPLPWVTTGPVDRVAANSARSGLRPQGTKPSGPLTVPATARTTAWRFAECRWRPVLFGIQADRRLPHGRVRQQQGLPRPATQLSMLSRVTPARVAARRRFTNCSCSGQRHRGYLACLGWSVPHGPLAPTNQQRAGHRP